MDQDKQTRVGLFVTCLVDVFRPQVGFAAVELLQRAGCQVEVPDTQTCCGQPGYNSGARADAAALARNVIRTFENYDYVVAPSGSCAAMLRHHYPQLFEREPAWRARASALAIKTHELTSFLVDVLGVTAPAASVEGSVTYHDSCSGLRELGVKQQPRQLLEAAGASIAEMADSETCCGFGGTFCVKQPEISTRMVDEKISRALASGATTLAGGDLGCLLNIAGRLSRQGSPMAVRHVAELLAGMGNEPPIGGQGG